MEVPTDAFLASTEVIDWQHPDVLARAKTLAEGRDTLVAIAERCFVYVRDDIRHTVDYKLDAVTVTASEALQQRTGFCFAKSHLLAALLRANGIPAGFCYQRLSIDDKGPPFALHGFNAVYLPKFGWYRIDARGDRDPITTWFDPPREWLAYRPRLPGEQTFDTIFPEPLPVVIEALRKHRTRDALQAHLPDWTG